MITFSPPYTYVTGTGTATVRTQSIRVLDIPNRVLIVMSSQKATAVSAITSVTYAGINLTFLAGVSANLGTDDPRAEIWYLVNPPVGIANAVTTYGASVNCCITTVIAYGVDQTNPFGTPGTAYDSTGLVSSVSAYADDGDTIIDVVARYHSTGAITCDASQTQLTNVVTGRTDNRAYNVRQGTSYKEINTGYDAYAMQWSWATTNRKWAAIAVALKPSVEIVYSIQPAEAVGIDTLMSSASPNTNYYTNVLLNVGNIATGTYRSLIKFDLSSIPTNAQIVSTKIVFVVTAENFTSVTPSFFYAYLVKKDWVENQVTWNIYSTGNSWDTPGLGADTDYYSTAIAATIIHPSVAVGDLITFDFEPSVIQQLVNGELPNYGFLLRSGVENLDRLSFASSSDTTAYDRPYFVVTYKYNNQLKVVIFRIHND